MKDFPSIDEVNKMLDEIAEEIPKPIYKGLNGGIVLLPDEREHPRSKNGSLFILGQYRRDITGRMVEIYYGSFKKVFWNLRGEALKEKLRDTLHHELTHHLESMAGDIDLEVQDEIDMCHYVEMNYAE